MHTVTTSPNHLTPWTVDELQQATGGHWSVTPSISPVKRILTNSKDIQTGDAFLALRGERFDAHDFAAQAHAQGASCAIVNRLIPDVDIPQLIVADTRIALGDLGRFRRQSCSDVQVIALTGSSGKTTTKEMLGSILHALGPTLITRGNLNNDLGVPMMLLELLPEHRFAVMELGANHKGEIAYTAALVQPHVVGVLNIGSAHLGEFGGRDGILSAKSEIYGALDGQGIAIVPAQDQCSAQLAQVARTHSASTLSFGQGGEIYAESIQLMPQSSRFDLITPSGKMTVTLPFAGLHNVHNAEAAAAFAYALKVDLATIAQGLAQAKTAQGRLNFHQQGRLLLIDDSYNANPHAMRAAADVLLQQSGIKVMVMGEIGELGDQTHTEHYQLGYDLAHKGLNYIVAVGQQADAVADGFKAAKAQQGHSHNSLITDLTIMTTAQNHAQALDLLLDIIKQHDDPMSLLFKGSRFTRMESLITALMEKI